MCETKFPLERLEASLQVGVCMSVCALNVLTKAVKRLVQCESVVHAAVWLELFHSPKHFATKLKQQHQRQHCREC